MIASIVSPQGVFSFLVNASGAAMLFLYMLIGAAQIRYRRTIGSDLANELPFKMWLYPALSYAVLIGIAFILLAMGFIPDLKSQLLTTIFAIVGLATIYGVFRRGRYLNPQPAADTRGAS